MFSKADVVSHFSAIAARYDLVNHVLSFSIDKLWRKMVVALSGITRGARVLDVCTGTGDVLLDLIKKEQHGLFVGIDFTENMLRAGKGKFTRFDPDSKIMLGMGDAMHLPFHDKRFDIVTISFGLRNLIDPMQGIAEMSRVACPGGRVIIMEFSPEQTGIFGFVYGLYLRYIIPKLGGVITGSKKAYDHLSTSIQAFLAPETIVSMMEKQGLSDIKAIPLFGKIAYIYVGNKSI
jgi:demethylmenaquinone methyltransferase/2-methoxy-6-polyprenyl-1,4-benzoquinol methylase